MQAYTSPQWAPTMRMVLGDTEPVMVRFTSSGSAGRLAKGLYEMAHAPVASHWAVKGTTAAAEQFRVMISPGTPWPYTRAAVWELAHDCSTMPSEKKDGMGVMRPWAEPPRRTTASKRRRAITSCWPPRACYRPVESARACYRPVECTRGRVHTTGGRTS
jgi:hypothetical protein